MKYYHLICTILSFCCIVNAQELSLFNVPKPQSATYYSNIDWDGSDIEFNNPRKAIWDFKKLRPSYIVKEIFKSNNDCDGCLSYFQENGNVNHYRIKSEQLTLTSVQERVSFTKSQRIEYIVIGEYHVLPVAVEEKKGLNNEYTLVATLAKSELNYQFDFLPNHTDSLKIEINIRENNRIINNGVIELYHLTESAALINTIIRSSMDLKIKYRGSEKWFNYNYRTTNLPPQLSRYASRIPKTLYKFYCKSYVFPVLEYEIKGKGASNIRIQDNVNAFQKPLINYDERFIYCNPNPVTRWANFYLSNFPISDYRIEITNCVDKNVQKASFRKQYENVFKMDMINLPYGIYFYEFVDSKGIKSPKQYFIKLEEQPIW